MLQTYEAPVVSHGAPSARVSPRKPRLEPPIIINSRKYWRQSTTDAFKAALQAYALDGSLRRSSPLRRPTTRSSP